MKYCLVYSSYISKQPKGVTLQTVWAGRNAQSTICCSLAGTGLNYGCYQINSEIAESIRYVAIAKREVLIIFFFSVNSSEI